MIIDDGHGHANNNEAGQPLVDNDGGLRAGDLMLEGVSVIWGGMYTYI